MIYTVTFNPSLDYYVTVDGFRLGRTNRTLTEAMFPGGKGINVSAVLHHLGMETTALGFAAGFVGDEIIKRTQEMGFPCEFIKVQNGLSRINVKLKDFDGTEINGRGPEVSERELSRLLDRLDGLTEGDVLVLAGSIPDSIPKSVYRDMMERLKDKGVLFAVDATGELLWNALEYKPFLIKPNHHELGALFGTELKPGEAVVPYARKLQEKGARNVLVSMSGDGAVLLSEEGEVYHLPAPEGKLVNAVGAGDSMVAGFLAGYLQRKDYLHAFKLGLAAGSATAFSEKLAEGEEIQKVYDTIRG